MVMINKFLCFMWEHSFENVPGYSFVTATRIEDIVKSNKIAVTIKKCKYCGEEK